MLSGNLSAWLARRNVHYGWVVAFTTFLTMLATAGAMGSAGVLIQPLHQEYGWDLTSISSAMAIRLVLFGLLGPFAAASMTHFGIRKVVCTALLLIVGGILLSFKMTKVWHLMILWGVVVGTGTGMTAMVLGAIVANRWFSKRRGLVVGMMSASNATGQLIFLPLLAELAESYGWRAAQLFITGVVGVAMVLVLLLMRDHPSELDLPAYGDSAVAPLPLEDHNFGRTLLVPLNALAEASRRPIFWVLGGTFFICGLSTNGLIQTHWISICGDFGLDPVKAAGTLAVLGVFDFFGTITAGWLSDRFDNRWLLFWFYGLRGLSLLYLSFSGFGIYELASFSVFYGLDWIATVPPTVKLAADSFGREKAGVIFGWVVAGHQLGAAVAAFGAGAIRSDFESYMPALQIAGMMCVLAALSVLLLKRPGSTRAAIAVAH